MFQDIRLGLRMLARNPGVTALAAIALALGIGGNTVIFSVVNAVLIRQAAGVGSRAAGLRMGQQPEPQSPVCLRRIQLLALIGVAAGIGGALALTRLMQGMLFGVTPTDPLAYLAVAALLVAISVFAAFVPARHAARISRSAALREE